MAMNARVAELVALFDEIARTRMADVPVRNPALRVEAVGFETDDDVAGGILITPWFMNLVRLPLQRDDRAAVIGRVQMQSLNGHEFEFITAHEPAIGAFEACSLFSPMAEFREQSVAVATAVEVLAQLRRRADRPGVELVEPRPARRSFLFGRSAVASR